MQISDPGPANSLLIVAALTAASSSFQDLLGVVLRCRRDIVGVQSHQLDKFHVKENLQQASKDIQNGRILQSMMIDKQTAALRNAIAAPFAKARDLLVKDIHEHDEFIDGEKE